MAESSPRPTGGGRWGATGRLAASSRLDGADLLHVGYPSLLPALMAFDADPLVALLTRARKAGVTTPLDLAVLDPDSPAVALDWPRLLARIGPGGRISDEASRVWSLAASAEGKQSRC